eukprot:3888196-Alexandrium_andersonii.AAC.1
MQYHPRIFGRTKPKCVVASLKHVGAQTPPTTIRPRARVGPLPPQPSQRNTWRIPAAAQFICRFGIRAKSGFAPAAPLRKCGREL